jgi:predicted GIY-YIG superfamily endonuclease
LRHDACAAPNTQGIVHLIEDADAIAIAPYVGVTSDLVRRVWQHREGIVADFTKTCGVKRLAWLETHSDIIASITREQQFKKWKPAWKIDLIQAKILNGATCMRISRLLEVRLYFCAKK